MDVSIIFVNYKTNKMLYEAIISIKEKCHKNTYEIIVVDNSVDDEVYADLENHSEQYNYKLIKSPGNIGVGNGGNLGEKYAKGNYLLFLNSDVIFLNDAIHELYEFITRRDDVGIVGGNLYNKDLSPNLTFINEDFNKWVLKKHFNYLGWACSKLKKKQPTFNFSDSPLEIKRMIIGAVLMISKSDFEILGGYDKDIFMYGEESLLCYRVIHELKKRIFNVPSAKIIHLDGGSYTTNTSEKREKARINGDFIFFSKALGRNVALNIYKNRNKILRIKKVLARLSCKKDIYKMYELRMRLYREKINSEKSKCN